MRAKILFDLKKMKETGGLLDLALFLIADIILLTLDVFLDLSTTLEFYTEGYVNFAAISFAFIFLPFCIRFLMALNKTTKMGLSQLSLLLWRACHSLPVVQTYQAVLRFIVMWEQSVFTTSAMMVNSIKEENAIAAIYEGCLEAAPSQIFNLYLILVTGSFTPAQLASMITSLLTLSLTGERVYFLYRTKQTKDVNPHWRLKLIVLPCMILNVLSNSILWALLAANAGLGVVVCIGFTITVIWAAARCSNSLVSTWDMFESTAQVATLTTWVPSAIGASRRMFLSLAVSSYATKSFLVLLFIWLRHVRAPFLSSPPLMSCISRSSIKGNESISASLCYSLTECFCGFYCEVRQPQTR